MWMKDGRVSVPCNDLQSWTFSCSFSPTFFPKGNAFSHFRPRQGDLQPTLIAEHALKTLIPGQDIKTTLQNQESHRHLLWWGGFFLSSPLTVPTYPFLFQGLLLFHLLPTTTSLHNRDKPHMQIDIKDQKCHIIFVPHTALWLAPSFYCNFFPYFPYTVGGSTGFAGFSYLFSITAWSTALIFMTASLSK